jgi:hypothetical protein
MFVGDSADPASALAEKVGVTLGRVLGATQ